MAETKLSRKPADAVRFLDAMIGDDPEMWHMIAEEDVKVDIAQQVYDAREAAGLTRVQLAERAGLTATIIEDLEEADYEGDAAAMLGRIAAALGRRVEVRMTPLESDQPEKR